jgi:uncharacterized protein YwgA
MKCGELTTYQGVLVRYVLLRGATIHIKLVKLLFLIDRELYRRFGATAFRWRMSKYGPLSCEVLDVVEELERDGLVVSRWNNGAVIYEPASATPAELPQEVREAADEVLGTWAHRSLDDIAEYVNNLEEVKKALPGKLLFN